MKLPEQPTPYLGIALLIAIGSFSIGGIIGALMAVPPTDGQINAITGVLSFLAGSLTGGRTSPIEEKKDARPTSPE